MAFLCSIWKICPKISHIQQKKDKLSKVGTINGQKLTYHYWLVYLEVLAPARILSKAFQSKDIDVVTTDSLLSQCKLQLQRTERKPFEELLTVCHFLEKVKVDVTENPNFKMLS